MKIAFVCTGNTCRSPIAEGYLNSMRLPEVVAVSRGLCAGGEQVSRNSVLAAKKLGFDISGHISKQLDAEALGADRIICMSESHKAALSAVGIKSEKISVLGSGISDPYGQTEEAYFSCTKAIADAIDRLVFGGLINGICVRRAYEGDVTAISELEKACFSEPWSENAIRESLGAGTLFFVAARNDRVIGYIGISSVCGEGYITNIAVCEGERGMGVGTLLIDRVLSLAVKQQLEFVSLEVRASNSTAMSLYTRLGFGQEGLRKKFYSNPTEDAIIMTRRFT